MHDVGEQDQGAGGGDRQELRDPLHHGNRDYLLDRHTPTTPLVPRASRFYTRLWSRAIQFATRWYRVCTSRPARYRGRSALRLAKAAWRPNWARNGPGNGARNSPT